MRKKNLDLTLRQSVEGSESYGSASGLTRSQGKAGHGQSTELMEAGVIVCD